MCLRPTLLWDSTKLLIIVVQYHLCTTTLDITMPSEFTKWYLTPDFFLSGERSKDWSESSWDMLGTVSNQHITHCWIDFKKVSSWFFISGSWLVMPYNNFWNRPDYVILFKKCPSSSYWQTDYWPKTFRNVFLEHVKVAGWDVVPPGLGSLPLLQTYTYLIHKTFTYTAWASLRSDVLIRSSNSFRNLSFLWRWLGNSLSNTIEWRFTILCINTHFIHLTDTWAIPLLFKEGWVGLEYFNTIGLTEIKHH